MPIEKLQAMIIKNQDEKLSLIEQKEALQEEEDDWMGDDPEMIDQKLSVWFLLLSRNPLIFRTLLTKRLKELKAALAARAGMTPSMRHTPPPAPSSTSTLASDPPQPVHYPTPDTVPGPSRPRLQPYPSNEKSVVRESYNHESPKRAFQALPFSAGTAVRTPKMAATVGARRTRQAPTPPPEIDDIDLAMAEESDSRQEQFIPPTSSPSPPPIATPSRSTRNTKGALARQAAIAAMENIPPDPPFLSNQLVSKSARPQSSAPKPIRANAVAGPSTQTLAKSVQATKIVHIETRHPWSKEVEDKMKTYFKIPRFRYHQKEAIDETMAGKDGECRLGRWLIV